jgi:methylamine---glutamate N-methyltransferase subunit C
VSGLSAPGFPEQQVRARARSGAAAVFPDRGAYGATVFGASAAGASVSSASVSSASASGAGQPPADPAPVRLGDRDLLDDARLVPPIFMPRRLDKLVDLGREPLHTDVDLRTVVGGFPSRLPLYISAFGSTRVASTDLGLATTREAARLGLPVVVGENVLLMNGYRDGDAPGLLDRILTYLDAAASDAGGVVVQQSTDDADAEVWNLVYSDTRVQPLLETGRLGFELKVGQGAKPGLGGMTLLGADAAAKASSQYAVESLYGPSADQFLRSGSPGTFTPEILTRQIQLMRNNFPRARVWIKLHPGRDVALAADAAWRAGADAVTVDGAEGGTGWAPSAFIEHVGLPLAECLLRVRAGGRPLLATGRVWEGTRVVKSLALGATAAGLGRAALIAADEDPDGGLTRLVESIELEMRLLISALGKYRVEDVGAEDLWLPRGVSAAPFPEPEGVPSASGAFR